jgi:hypothetical protein
MSAKKLKRRSQAERKKQAKAQTPFKQAGTFLCEHGCGFAASFSAVAWHEEGGCPLVEAARAAQQTPPKVKQAAPSSIGLKSAQTMLFVSFGLLSTYLVKAALDH